MLFLLTVLGCWTSSTPTEEIPQDDLSPATAPAKSKMVPIPHDVKNSTDPAQKKLNECSDKYSSGDWKDLCKISIPQDAYNSTPIITMFRNDITTSHEVGEQCQAAWDCFCKN